MATFPSRYIDGVCHGPAVLHTPQVPIIVVTFLMMTMIIVIIMVIMVIMMSRGTQRSECMRQGNCTARPHLPHIPVIAKKGFWKPWRQLSWSWSQQDTPFSECFTWQNLTVKVINLCFRCYVSGRLDGTAKYYYTSGAIESRMYENGVLQVTDNNCDDEHVGKTIFSL